MDENQRGKKEIENDKLLTDLCGVQSSFVPSFPLIFRFFDILFGVSLSAEKYHFIFRPDHGIPRFHVYPSLSSRPPYLTLNLPHFDNLSKKKRSDPEKKKRSGPISHPPDVTLTMKTGPEQ